MVLQVNLPNYNLVASGDTGSQVYGIITSDTTWTIANSPYIITSTIQIPENVTLTIEPGVTVTAQSSIGTMFLINGFIQARGNEAEKIIFDGNGKSNIFKTNHAFNQAFVDLDYCIIRNGQSAFWFANTGFFNLTNSELRNLSQESYLWYPSQDVYIEFNTFTNTSGIKVGTVDNLSNSSGAVYIKYNLFIDNLGYIINNFASYGLSKTYVNNNSFNGTIGIILEVEKTSTTADMDASQNYWGTNDTSIIDSMIYDQNDDVSCSSYINFLPILDSPDPNAPLAPTPTSSPINAPTPTDTPAPTSLPTTSPDPSSIPDPSMQPTISPTQTTPTSTATPAPSQLNSPTPDPTYDPTNPNPNPTVNIDTSGATTSPSTAPSIPEFPISIALLIILATGSMGSILLKKKLW